MEKDAVIGKRKIMLGSIDSTQIFADALFKQNKILHGTVVVTKDQYMGKGRNVNAWQSLSGKNFTGSYFIRHVRGDFNIGLLQMISAISVCNTINYFSKNKAMIKWPNDVLIGKKKISGILINNYWRGSQIDATIMGIGINVNQSEFEQNLVNATSLFIENGAELDLNNILHRLSWELNQWFPLLYQESDKIKPSYISLLSHFNQPVNMRIVATGEIKSGKIIDVNLHCHILVQFTQDDIRIFDIDQVKLLLA